MSSRKHKARELRVLFDTNTVRSGHANFLVALEVKTLISENSGHADLKILWYLPTVVKGEREYQMLNQGEELLPYVQKLERLLGHNLNITTDILKHRVSQIIEDQLKSLGLIELSLDMTKVDWAGLISASCFRQPPFSGEGGEKGFRDAVIAETFYQLIESSPTSKSLCRLIMVTGDRLLAEAVRSRTHGSTNVQVLSSVDELKGLISTLVSEVTEEYVSKHQDRVRAFFFQEGNDDCLYQKMNISELIEKQYRDRFQELPSGASRRKQGTWYIHSPQFVKKEAQTVFWSTRITVETEAYKLIDAEPQAFRGLRVLGDAAVLMPPPEERLAFKLPSLGTARDIPTTPAIARESTRKHINTGKTIFEILWSIQITTRNNIRNPKIHSIDYVGTDWLE